MLLLALTHDTIGTVVGASAAVAAMLSAEMAYLYQHRKLLGNKGRDRSQRILLFSAINLLVGVMYSAGTPTACRRRWQPGRPSAACSRAGCWAGSSRRSLT
ncbi:MAG: hypothetical protein U0694_26900 [Anaerolineae bacterium]